MTSQQIWSLANDQRELIRSINLTLGEGGDINAGMNELKRRIPSLFGIDYEQRALVFNSTDEGLVAVRVEEQGESFMLTLSANIALEAPEDTEMGMLPPEM